jgi:hypothetical protein
LSILLIGAFLRRRGGDVEMNRKDVVIGFLLGLCLTTTLFAVVPTRSQSGVYDPWNDVNDDGVIDMADISIAIESFMASGDPTKNVTITGRANKLITLAPSILIPADSYWDSGWVSIDGCSKVSVCVCFASIENLFRLYFSHQETPQILFLADYGENQNFYVRSYDVMNQAIRIIVVNTNTEHGGDLWVDLYLIP